MIAPLAKFIDWSVLQLANVVVPLRHVPKPKWKLEEALEFLNGPDFIPAASEPARIEFDGPRNFSFPTPRPSEDQENNIVYGRLYRYAERWQERPVIILLDGEPAAGYHTVFPLIARRFNRAGFNVALLVAPHSLQRRPRRPLEWDCLKVARSVAQNVAEIRSLTGWLLDEGCPSVGLLGISYGGWLAGMAACSDARIACAVLTVPGVRMTESRPVIWPWVRETLQALRPAHEAMDTTRLNLILSTPVIPKEKILVIEGIHDLLAERRPIEELWQKWQQPEIWLMPHGHVSAQLRLGLMGRVLRWLAPRLEKPFSPASRTPPNPVQAAGSAGLGASDRECLESWARHGDAAGLGTLVERYLVFVHSSALRRTGDAAQAAEATRAVFLVLGRRALRLPKKTMLAGWLFHVTALACRKLNRLGRFRRLWQWLSRKPSPELPPDATLWTRLAPQMDRALERLPTKQRNALLLCAFLNHDVAATAKGLRTGERCVEKHLGRGMKKLAKRLGRHRAPVDPVALAAACAAEGCAVTVPEGLSLDMLHSMEASRGQRPSLELARRTLNSLAWLRWRRRLVIGYLAVNLLIAILGGIVVYVDSLSGYGRLRSEAILWGLRFWGWWQLSEMARAWPTNAATPQLDASTLRNAEELYRTTNIWHAHLRFTPEQWKALEFKRIGPMPNAVRPDGMMLLLNHKARRGGAVGVLGFEFDWTHADFEFGGVAFTNVAARVKGNLRSLHEPTRAYKVDLNKFVPGQKLADRDELTFNSLVWDYSCVSAALGYEFFRDAGVPAPRTAYAWLSTSVTTRWEKRPLGLFFMEEAVDNEFAKERFGSKATPIFKPVTYTLFEHFGDEWSAYAPIYDLKTKATPDQQRRVIDFARLVSSATDVEFAAQVGDYLDLDGFARFLACQVLLPSYDGILVNGQNFYLYLDLRSNKLGFIPWDLDVAWGSGWIVPMAEQERASIWHPWVGQNRFIERVMSVEEFRRIYRSHLEDFVARLYVPVRLHRRIDEIAAVIREPIAAQSAFRLDKFEQTVGLKPVHPSPGERPDSFNWPAHEMKRFIERRAESVRLQLDGKSKGMILKYPKEKQ